VHRRNVGGEEMICVFYFCSVGIEKAAEGAEVKAFTMICDVDAPFASCDRSAQRLAFRFSENSVVYVCCVWNVNVIDSAGEFDPSTQSPGRSV
jgi:hypothetical protein